MQRVNRILLRRFHQRNGHEKLSKNQQKPSENQAISRDLLSIDPLKEQKYSGNDILHGVHPIMCAIAAKRRTIHTVYYRRDLADSQRIRNVLEECWKENITTKPIVRKMITSDNKPHQNLFAQATRLHYNDISLKKKDLQELDNAQELSKKVWLLLHGIQDPMNFGSLLRTAYWMGVDKIFVTSRESCALTPTVSKASSGVMELVPIYSIADPTEFITNLQELHWNIIGTQSKPGIEDNTTSIPVNKYQLLKPSLLIFGNEGSGIPKNILSMCHHSVYIRSRTQSTFVDSLNVSSAAAIILHSILLGKD